MCLVIESKGPFLKSPDNFGALKVCGVQNRGFNRFANHVIKLSVDKTKWNGLLARKRAFILYSVSEKLAPEVQEVFWQEPITVS